MFWFESFQSKELSNFQVFYDGPWLTLTFDPVTLNMPSISCVPIATIYCDQFH